MCIVRIAMFNNICTLSVHGYPGYNRSSVSLARCKKKMGYFKLIQEN